MSRRPVVVYNAITANDSVRGVERYHLGILPALVMLDPNLRILVLRAPWQRYYGPLTEVKGLEVVTVAPPRSRIRRGVWQFVDGGMRSRHLDLLHLGNVIPAPMRVSVPIVAMVHDVIEFRLAHSYGPMRRWARQYLVRRLARRAQALVTVADTTAHELEGLLDLRPGSVVPVGIGVESARPRPLVLAACRDWALVFVGGLDPHKRLDVVLAALPRIADLELRIISAGGPAERSLRTLADRLGVTSQVRWLGPLSDADAADVIAKSAALVLPSDLEGFGIPVLEALQCGTPVVLSSGVPLAQEWERYGGPVFRAADGEDLAVVLARFLEDAPRRDSLAALGPRMAARFTWSDAAKRLHMVWEDVLQGGSVQPSVPHPEPRVR